MLVSSADALLLGACLVLFGSPGGLLLGECLVLLSPTGGLSLTPTIGSRNSFVFEVFFGCGIDQVIWCLFQQTDVLCETTHRSYAALDDIHACWWRCLTIQPVFDGQQDEDAAVGAVELQVMHCRQDDGIDPRLLAENHQSIADMFCCGGRRYVR
jgi:hypothetical protein